jgi:predicted ATPase/DNA-binding winged helix-turn-helix (wHTH) protein
MTAPHLLPACEAVGVHRFGDCEVDVGARELRRCGESVHLEPQAFDLLVLLLEHRDRVVSKTELLDGVWGTQFVSDASLTTRVKEVRRAIGDDGARQSVIRNVRGRGYRFVAPVDVGGRTAVSSGAPPTGLVGRDGELASIAGLLTQSALVTIIGPGGVGKSALARAIVAGASHSDGVHLVELAALDSGSDVAVAVARALDVVLDSGRPDDAVRTMARLDALLVLDNCEHVIDEAALLVDRLLSASEANLRIVATSQVRLGLSAEAVVPVEPLDLSAATALFIHRAHAVVATWSVDEVGRDRVERLVSLLDRLPLTVEMAAARLGSMAFEELEASVTDGAALLQMTHRAPARRHRSLGSVVEWSTELLGPEHRQLFSAFSVFAGRVSSADVCSVLAPGDPAAARFDLALLAERSLVVAERDGPDIRYGMLTTVRAVAADWLRTSGAAQAVHRRHAEYLHEVLLDVDDVLRTPDEPEGRRRLASIVDEARAAHRWATRNHPQLASDLNAALFHAAHSVVWFEPSEWSASLLEAHPKPESDGLWGAILASAGAAVHRGDLLRAQAWASAAAGATSGRLQGIAFELLADIGLYRGDIEAALRAAEELRRCGSELGDAHMLALAAGDSALAQTLAGDFEAALAHLHRADLPELAPTDAAWLAFAWGQALSLEPGAAVAAFDEAIRLGSLVGNRYVVSMSRTHMAREYAEVGEVEQALDAYALAIGDYFRHGSDMDAVTMLKTMVWLLEAVGEDRGATILGGATEDAQFDGLAYFGERTVTTLQRVRDRVGHGRFDAWTGEGRVLDLDQALTVAARLVAQRRS